MKESVLIISGWAHGLEAIRPMGDALSDVFDIRLMSGNEVLKKRGIPDADIIITGSMGGLLALELLPDRCRKLVLISSTARFCAGEDYPCGIPERILQRMVLRMQKDPAAVLRDFYINVHAPHPPLPTDPGCPPAELVNGLEYLLHADLRDSIPGISIPVLLLHGAQDRIIPAAAAEWLQEHLPDSRLQIFPGAGHALPAHHFEDVMKALRSFLADQTAG